jgi:hypothetical protein
MWRVRMVYDKQEVRDVLRYLQQESFVEMRHATIRTEHKLLGGSSSQDDLRGDNSIFWFIGAMRHWYQV